MDKCSIFIEICIVFRFFCPIMIFKQRIFDRPCSSFNKQQNEQAGLLYKIANSVIRKFHLTHSSHILATGILRHRSNHGHSVSEIKSRVLRVRDQSESSACSVYVLLCCIRYSLGLTPNLDLNTLENARASSYPHSAAMVCIGSLDLLRRSEALRILISIRYSCGDIPVTCFTSFTR